VDCGVQTLPFTMHYGGEKLGKKWWDFNPQRTGSYDLGSRQRCKLSSKLNENCDSRRGDRQTGRQTQMRVILLSVPCYAIVMGQIINDDDIGLS